MSRTPRRCLLATAVAAVFGLNFPASAQVARVLDSRGAAVVERAGAAPRILGVGEPLDQRDTINVAPDSWAMLEFADQTRVTLRPNTVFRIDAYNDDAPGSVLLGLVKGGLRAVTGLVAKRNPRGVQFQTAVATIGVRGTEFDARLCEADCAAEENARPPAPATTVVARVIELEGNAMAARLGGPPRLLVPGANLYEGDQVDTADGTRAVVVFVDGTRLSLGERSRAHIDVYAYDERRPEDNRALLRLAAGAVTVETGNLAKLAPGRYEITTPRGTIRPRGTTFSVVMRPAAAVAQTVPTGSTAPAMAATPAQQAGAAQGTPTGTAAPAQTTPSGKPTSGAGSTDGGGKTQATPPPGTTTTTATTTGMAASSGQQAAVTQGTPTGTAAPAQTTPSGKPTSAAGSTDGGGKTQATPPPGTTTTTATTTGMAASPGQQAAVAQGTPTGTTAPAQTTPSGKPAAGAGTTSGGEKTPASPPPQSTTAEALPGVSSGAAVVTSSGPGATIGREAAASAVPTPVRQLLGQMIGRINLNADQTVASVRQAQSMTDPAILRLTGARDPQTYDINLRQVAAGTNAGQLFDSMREWHRVLTSHPVYGPSFVGLVLPDLTDIADPARLAALVESWFLRIDEHPNLGRGFESIDTSRVFAGEAPALATRTATAVATTRSLPGETPTQETVPARRAETAQATTVAVPTDTSTLRPVTLGAEDVTLLGRMESSMERQRSRPLFGGGALGGSVITAPYQAISLPSFTPGMSTADTLRTFQQWRETMLVHPEYGPALQGLPAASLADLQDPARTAALLRQWYTMIASTPLGDQFAAIDTSAVFTSRPVAKPDLGVAGTTAGSTAPGTQSGQSGPQIDAQASPPPQSTTAEALPGVSSGAAVVTSSGPGASIGREAAASAVPTPVRQLLRQMIGRINLNADQTVASVRQAQSITDPGIRRLTGARDPQEYDINLRQAAAGANAGQLLDSMREWHRVLTSHPVYGPSFVGLVLPDLTDIVDPARLAALVESWFLRIDEHPNLGRGFESIDTSRVFAGEAPALATRTATAVATTRSLPTETPPQDTVPARRAETAQATAGALPTDTSALRPAGLGVDAVTLLGRMESSMERSRSRDILGVGNLGSTYQAISLPSFTPGMSAADVLQTFQQWREIMLAHPQYGPALQGLPAATLADLQDPARTAALLQQWYTMIANTSLGDQFAAIDTSAVFTGRLLAKPGLGVAGTTAGSTAPSAQSGESGPLLDALGNLPIAPEYNALFVQLAIAATSGSRTAANVRDSPGLAVSLELPRPPLDTGAALRLLQSWYTALTSNPNYRAYIADRLPVPRIGDVAEPARFQALMQDWFTTLGQHPVLGSSIGARSIMGRSYDWLFADEIVTVSSGAVDVVTQAGTTSVGSGAAVRISGAGATSPSPFVAADRGAGAASGGTGIDPTSIGPRAGDRAVTPGLYVWVRDGAVQVTSETQAVDVPSGAAVRATRDAVALLDTVPGFLRFDTTPRPAPAGGGSLIDNFRATDGSTQHMCRVR